MPKKTVESYSKNISISFLRDHWYLLEGSTREGKLYQSIGIEVKIEGTKGYLRAFFVGTDTESGEIKDFDYKITLYATDCNYGGLRWWFIDPDNAERLCTKLYFQDNGHFASRETLNLSYRSRNESRAEKSYKYLFPSLDIASNRLREKIKYPYRNGKPTRKMKRYIKMTHSPYTDTEIERMKAKIIY